MTGEIASRSIQLKLPESLRELRCTRRSWDKNVQVHSNVIVCARHAVSTAIDTIEPRGTIASHPTRVSYSYSSSWTSCKRADFLSSYKTKQPGKHTNTRSRSWLLSEERGIIPYGPTDVRYSKDQRRCTLGTSHVVKKKTDNIAFGCLYQNPQ